MKKYVIISIIALLSWIAVLTFQLEREKKETTRLTANQTSLLEDVTSYRTQDSLSAASTQRLVLTLGEYVSHFADQAEIIKSLNLKLKRVQSVNTTVTTTQTPVWVQLKDSVVLRDSLVWLECMELHTPHLDLNGCIENHVFAGTIIQRDTLTHIVHRVPKKWWFFRFGTKAIRMEVMSSNPHTRLTYANYVELK